jgi:hypothetical protein
MKRIAVVRAPDKPVFLYTSVCCGARAEKQPCVKPKTKKETEVNSLGSWTCSTCRKSCKCTRQKNKLDETSAVC